MLTKGTIEDKIVEINIRKMRLDAAFGGEQKNTLASTIGDEEEGDEDGEDSQSEKKEESAGPVMTDAEFDERALAELKGSLGRV